MKMSYFKDQKEMYAIQRAFFDRVARDPGIGPQLQKSRLIVRFKVHDPDGTITINCRDVPEEGKYFDTSFGETDLRPDLTLLLSADLCHEMWQGRANILTAVLGGKARAEGDISQAMKFIPLLQPVVEIYPQVLKDLGRPDLVLK
jgi:hypothetical protein